MDPHLGWRIEFVRPAARVDLIACERKGYSDDFGEGALSKPAEAKVERLRAKSGQLPVEWDFLAKASIR